jgi:hypothetical protein
MLCIFCLQDQAPSREDVFPLAIGGGLVIDRVCAGCNSTLGAKVDAPLCNHPIIVRRRAQLKLAGQSGVVPGAFPRILTGKAALASDPTRNVIVSAPRGGGPPEVKLSTKKTVLPDGDVEIQVDAEDPESARRQIQKIIQRHFEKTRPTTMTTEHIDQVVNDAWAKRQLQTIENPRVIHSIPFDPNSCHRGVVKIAYELATIWLGDEYVTKDATAASLREFLLGGADATKVRGSIAWKSSPNHLLGSWAADKDCHVAVSSWVEDIVLITLKIFDVIEAGIVVSTEPAGYLTGLFDPRRIRFLHLNPTTNEKRDTSLIDEMGRLARSRLGTCQP